MNAWAGLNRSGRDVLAVTKAPTLEPQMVCTNPDNGLRTRLGSGQHRSPTTVDPRQSLLLAAALLASSGAAVLRLASLPSSIGAAVETAWKPAIVAP